MKNNKLNERGNIELILAIIFIAVIVAIGIYMASTGTSGQVDTAFTMGSNGLNKLCDITKDVLCK